MTTKIEAEFDSVDLAERAARVIRSKVPDVSAIYIHPTRSAYTGRADNWRWSRGMSGGSRNQVEIRELLPTGRGIDEENEPDQIRSARLSCFAGENSIREASGTLRNLGGLNVRIFY